MAKYIIGYFIIEENLDDDKSINIDFETLKRNEDLYLNVYTSNYPYNTYFIHTYINNIRLKTFNETKKKYIKLDMCSESEYKFNNDDITYMNKLIEKLIERPIIFNEKKKFEVCI